MADNAEPIEGWILEDEDDTAFFFDNFDDPEALDERLDRYPADVDADDSEEDDA